MIRSSTAFASLAVVALVAAVPLATARAEAGNVVGGGGASGGSALPAQPGRLARFSGSHGDGQLVEYLSPASANPGPQARLVGGGDNAEVVYDRR